jgi:hypothetical protein
VAAAPSAKTAAFTVQFPVIIGKTEKENEMGPNTLSIMMGAGGLVATLVAYLVYSSFKRA